MIQQNNPNRSTSIVAYDQQGFPLVNVNGRYYTLTEIPQNPVPPYFQPSPTPITPQDAAPDPWASGKLPLMVGATIVISGASLMLVAMAIAPKQSPIVVPGQSPDQSLAVELLRQQNATLQGQLGQIQGQNQQLQQQLQAKPTYERRCEGTGFLNLNQVCTEVRR